MLLYPGWGVAADYHPNPFTLVSYGFRVLGFSVLGCCSFRGVVARWCGPPPESGWGALDKVARLRCLYHTHHTGCALLRFVVLFGLVR